MDKYDTSQITEFPRFEPESTQSGVSTFFNKLWKFPVFSPSDSNENNQEKTPIGADKNVQLTDAQKNQEYDDSKTETGSYAVEFEGRSLSNVLKRISSLIALGSGGQGTRYADTELARYWMPDDISRECYECASRFSTLRRRHHCRVCGQIFCSRCCSQRVPGQIFGCAGGLRVCNYCCNVVLSYLRENDMTGEIPPDLRTLQENLQVKFPENKATNSKTRENFMFAREQEERGDIRPPPPLHELHRQLVEQLPTHQHRYRLVRYNNVWRGCDILQWVMDNTNNKTRFQASQVCQNLLSSGYMECMTELLQFADYALYRPAEIRNDDSGEESTAEESGGRIVGSVSSYCLNLNLDNSSARLIKTSKAENKSPSSEEEAHPVLDQEGYTESRHVCKALAESGEEHLKLLMRQCLSLSGLAASWLQALYPLCVQATEFVMIDMYSNDIDIRKYVQVKKVPGGDVSECSVIHGVVLSKNVAHRGMPQYIENPRILLLDCSIAYQRVEGKLTSLEPLLLQEQQYLARCAARITSLQPSVVLVRGGVGRAVQDALRHASVALGVRVRRSALVRTARQVRADLAASIHARVGAPTLGTAQRFRVCVYPSKTLMIFEGCAEPNLGCCILLRGGCEQELIRVKKVVKFMLLACYNWKLEKAFLNDIDAILPEAGMTFDDDEQGNENNDLTTDSIHITDVNPETAESNLFKSKGMTEESNNSFANSENEIGNIFKNSELTKEENNETDDIFKHKVESQEVIKEDLCDKRTEVADDKKIEKVTETKDDLKSSDPDDPLQRTKHKKTESDKNLSCGVPIRDFSDPLRATLSVDDEVFLPKEEAKLKADSHTERWCSDDAVLSMSPHTALPAPYLERGAGARCAVRRYFPAPLLAARAAASPAPARRLARAASAERADRPHQKYHPFIHEAMTAAADDPEVRARLAHYRATGGVGNGPHKPECPQYKITVLKPAQKDRETESEKQVEKEPLDPFSPESHQRLSVLLYSYSSKSANVPDFCVNPWVVTMEMYGQHDISIGAFLEKYCFNSEYKCPSNNCQVPMNQHVRRFVHSDVCITITCNTIGHSNVDKVSEEQSKQVMFWSRCEQCETSSRPCRLSRTALGVSLATYLRLRAHCRRPVLRAPPCVHPLHVRTHFYSRRLTTASFKYSKISTYDVQLPPKVISTKYDTKKMREALIQQLNDLMLRGHETFSILTDSEAEKEYQSFKQHSDQTLVALTSSNLQHKTLAGVVRSLWSISDRLIFGEKMLCDAQEKWAAPQRHSKLTTTDVLADEKSDVEESTGDSVNNDSSDNASKDNTGTEEDEEKGDKKTVRQILSQLLPNNQPSNQAGIIISSGILPVVVRAADIGSMIAATLASVTYQRMLRQARLSTQTEPEESENTSSGKDKTDGDKSKAAKSNDHIEVLLKDSLICRVYYAGQFHRLRHALLAPLSVSCGDTGDNDSGELGHSGDTSRCGEFCVDSSRCGDSKSLCDIEEGFVRSLAQCVPWAARGGKSGSTFCKTKDDRYVLKEMTKPEWQQFLDFAPHYFNYVTNCHQNDLPSLLARIVGVYSVGGAGNGILVMENVWYLRGHHQRYDLKGAARRRLDDPGPVLLDEHLLAMRWETPLFVRSSVGRALLAGVERDTLFLSQHLVMDYSLLLAHGPSSLQIGLVDYIRTFTWDKKLEHLVKRNLGSGQPTVLSPLEYRRRFIGAIKKYFLPCPEPWDHFYQMLH